MRTTSELRSYTMQRRMRTVPPSSSTGNRITLPGTSTRDRLLNIPERPTSIPKLRQQATA